MNDKTSLRPTGRRFPSWLAGLLLLAVGAYSVYWLVTHLPHVGPQPTPIPTLGLSPAPRPITSTQTVQPVTPTYVALATSTPELISPPRHTQVKIKEAILRKAPDAASPETGRLHFGALLLAVARQGDWVQVQRLDAQQTADWTLALFLDLGNSATNTPTQATPAVTAAANETVFSIPTLADTPSICTVTPPPKWVKYAVQPGDTLRDLAARSGIDIKTIMQVNCLQGTQIKTGAPLYLPPRIYAPPVNPPRQTPTPRPPTLVPSATNTRPTGGATTSEESVTSTGLPKPTVTSITPTPGVTESPSSSPAVSSAASITETASGGATPGADTAAAAEVASTPTTTPTPSDTSTAGTAPSPATNVTSTPTTTPTPSDTSTAGTAPSPTTDIVSTPTTAPILVDTPSPTEARREVPTCPLCIQLPTATPVPPTAPPPTDTPVPTTAPLPTYTPEPPTDTPVPTTAPPPIDTPAPQK